MKVLEGTYHKSAIFFTEKQVLPIFHLWASVIRPKFIKVVNSKTGKVMRKKPTNEEVRESLYMLVEVSTYRSSTNALNFTSCLFCEL